MCVVCCPSLAVFKLHICTVWFCCRYECAAGVFVEHTRASGWCSEGFPLRYSSLIQSSGFSSPDYSSSLSFCVVSFTSTKGPAKCKAGHACASIRIYKSKSYKGFSIMSVILHPFPSASPHSFHLVSAPVSSSSRARPHSSCSPLSSPFLSSRSTEKSLRHRHTNTQIHAVCPNTS